MTCSWVIATTRVARVQVRLVRIGREGVSHFDPLVKARVVPAELAKNDLGHRPTTDVTGVDRRDLNRHHFHESAIKLESS